MTLRDWLASLGTRDRRALRMGAWIVGLMLFVSLVGRPYVTSTLAIYSSLDQERALLDREARAMVQLPADRATLQATTGRLAAAAPRLFNGADAVTASAELARYATAAATESGLTLEQTETETRLDSGARLVDVPLQIARGGSADGNLRVSIRARGRILAIHTFLRAMEEGPKLVRVDRIEIARASTDDAFDGTLTLMATVSGLARRSVSSDSGSAGEEKSP